MWSICEIRKMPTVVTEVPPKSNGVHESTLRAYNILNRVKGWLEDGVPHTVIVDMIVEMEVVE